MFVGGSDPGGHQRIPFTEWLLSLTLTWYWINIRGAVDFKQYDILKAISFWCQIH